MAILMPSWCSADSVKYEGARRMFVGQCESIRERRPMSLRSAHQDIEEDTSEGRSKCADMSVGRSMSRSARI